MGHEGVTEGQVRTQAAGASERPASSPGRLVGLVLSWAICMGMLAGLVWLLGSMPWRTMPKASALGLCAALVPSLLVLGYQLLGVRRTLDLHCEAVAQYRSYVRHYSRTYTGGQTPITLGMAMSEMSVDQRSQTQQLAFSALLLVMPFAGLALLMGMNVEPLLPGGLRGLRLAGSGVYAYTLVLTIFRIRTAAVSSEFLLAATLRALILMVVGYVLGLLLSLSPNSTEWTEASFFGIGLFPNLGLRVIKQRMRRLLAAPRPGEDPLSLEYIDGITEPVAERLEELGIFDVQHLARVEPGWLSIQTRYPLSRITDWMDQALLISYLREKIIPARHAGIRGAMDLRGLYLSAISSVPAGAEPHGRLDGQGASPPASALLDPGWRARTVLQDLSTRGGLPLPTLYTVGAILAKDVLVGFLTYLQQDYSSLHGLASPRRSRQPPTRKRPEPAAGRERTARPPELLARA